MRDHFIEKHEAIKRGDIVSPAESHEGQANTDSKQIADEWALKYLEIEYLQPIMEAFDDDASGFITINEVNNFTKSRPLDWRQVLLILVDIQLTKKSLVCSNGLRIGQLVSLVSTIRRLFW